MLKDRTTLVIDCVYLGGAEMLWKCLEFCCVSFSSPYHSDDTISQ